MIKLICSKFNTIHIKPRTYFTYVLTNYNSIKLDIIMMIYVMVYALVNSLESPEMLKNITIEPELSVYENMVIW